MDKYIQSSGWQEVGTTLRWLLRIQLHIPSTHVNERVVKHEHIHNIRDFPRAKLDIEINARFLLNEDGDLHFFIS